MAHEITPDELDSPAKAKSGYNETHAVEDGKGRVWVWSDPSFSGYASLRGVLVFTDEHSELHDLTSSLKKGAEVLAIARADERHMWVAVENDGVYRVDIDTFALERLPDPAPKALCRVHELFVDGGDLYAVQDVVVSGRTLWRLRDGQWTQLISRLDDSQSHGSMPRSWLPIKEGLLVQSYPSDPWFIPREGEPARFSWRSGFPMESARAFARFADGTFFAIGNGSRFVHLALDLPPRERQNPRLLDLDSNGGWTLDASGHPWTTLKQTPESISEWDGEKWIAHPVPGGNFTHPQNITPDHEGRIWVNIGGAGDHQKTWAFDTAADQWQTFDNTQAAYLAVRDRPPHYLTGRMFDIDPQYSADRQRIAYRAGAAYVLYYDGSAWQRLNRFQITGKNEDNAVGPPWFDAEGKLRVNLRPGMSWRRDEAGKWSEVPFQSHFPTDIWSENTNHTTEKPSPPEGCVTDKPDSIVVDNLGTFWLTWQQALYKCVPGRCVKVFGADEPNPFISGRQLREAFVDPRGNAFLLTASAAMNAFILKPKSAPPRTGLSVEPVGADSVRVRLHADAGQPVQFRWRLDDGPWRLTGDDTLPLYSLPAGSHRVVVSGVDAELQTEAPPVAATFEVKIDPARQIAGFISRLSDPDYAQRNAAVRALALQPDRAIPALRQARETAEGDTPWWIDAALQQIETAKQAGTGNPGESPSSDRK